MKNILILMSLVLSFVTSKVSAQVVPVGTIRGNCTMMADKEFMVSNNLKIDSKGAQLPNRPVHLGGGVYPVTQCPNTGSHLTGIKCADGWKPIMREVSQMDCRSSTSAPMCWLYYLNYACAKL